MGHRGQHGRPLPHRGSTVAVSHEHPARVRLKKNRAQKKGQPWVERLLVVGCCLLLVACCLLLVAWWLVVGGWWLVVGGWWLLVVVGGCWLLLVVVVGCWLLVVGCLLLLLVGHSTSNTTIQQQEQKNTRIVYMTIPSFSINGSSIPCFPLMT